MALKKKLTAADRVKLLKTLKERFEKNMIRHKNLEWSFVLKSLEANEEKLWSLYQMEASGGEPDLVTLDKSKSLTYVDCSAESPKERRSVAYDREGQLSRKEHRPENNAVDLASEIGIDLLTEEQYRSLQMFGEFDLKTSSWIKTPEAIRKLGGALFCDRRYDHVFVYHNGAQSYYAARGFRGLLRF